MDSGRVGSAVQSDDAGLQFLSEEVVTTMKKQPGSGKINRVKRTGNRRIRVSRPKRNPALLPSGGDLAAERSIRARLKQAETADEEGARVLCPKCGSVMVFERFIDYQQTGEPTFRGWRCLSCGLILDPVILIHRAQQSKEQKSALPEELFAGLGED